MQQLSKTTKLRPASSNVRCAHVLLDVLPGILWFVRRHMGRHKGAGLSLPQFRALVILERYPESALCVIADSLAATPPTVSRIISGLVRKGYVRRLSDKTDRRRLSLVLTERGRRITKTARESTQQAVAGLLKDGSDGELNRVMETLEFLGARFDICNEHSETRKGRKSEGAASCG